MGAKSALNFSEYAEEKTARADSLNTSFAEKAAQIPQPDEKQAGQKADLSLHAEVSAEEAEADFFEPSFAQAPAAEPFVTGANSASNPFPPLKTSKKFVPPVLSDTAPETVPDMTTDRQAADFGPAGNTVQGRADSFASEKSAQPKKVSFREKIEQARQAQEESQRRFHKSDENGPPSEKSIPVDAVNIINLPADEGPDGMYGGTADYSDDEDRLANAAYNDGTVPHYDLFSEHTVSEDEKENIDWHEFLAYCENHGFPAEYIPLMQNLKVTLTKTDCFIKVSSGPQATIFSKVKNQLEEFLCEFLGRKTVIRSTIVAYELASDAQLREKAMNNPQIQQLMNEFGAEIYRCYDIKHDRKN